MAIIFSVAARLLKWDKLVYDLALHSVSPVEIQLVDRLLPARSSFKVLAAVRCASLLPGSSFCRYSERYLTLIKLSDISTAWNRREWQWPFYAHICERRLKTLKSKLWNWWKLSDNFAQIPALTERTGCSEKESDMHSYLILQFGRNPGLLVHRNTAPHIFPEEWLIWVLLGNRGAGL